MSIIIILFQENVICLRIYVFLICACRFVFDSDIPLLFCGIFQSSLLVLHFLFSFR